jgi:hypothetical protein
MQRDIGIKAINWFLESGAHGAQVRPREGIVYRHDKKSIDIFIPTRGNYCVASQSIIVCGIRATCNVTMGRDRKFWLGEAIP